MSSDTTHEGKEKIIYFLTGASGVGKTSLVSRLKDKYKNNGWAFRHFDEIGVPPVSQMEKQFGSPSRWQQAKAHEWIDKLVCSYVNEKIFFEGQVNLQFIKEGFEKHNFKNYKIILLDCSEEEMEKRLIHQRKQPELFNTQMIKWLNFLRDQARKFEAIRIDTTFLSEEQVLKKFEE